MRFFIFTLPGPGYLARYLPELAQTCCSHSLIVPIRDQMSRPQAEKNRVNESRLVPKMKQTSSLWLYTYWESVRNGRPAPLRFEIEPGRIGPILPETFILECLGKNKYKFRLAGTKMCDFFGRELKGRDFLELWDKGEDRQAVLTLLQGIKTDFSAPVLQFDGISAEKGSTGFEILMLPLLHTSTKPNRIVGCMSAIKSPPWLGVAPLEKLCLRDIELLWPNQQKTTANESFDANVIKADTMFRGDVQSAQNRDPINMREGRIVELDDRRFRVIDGGRENDR